MLALLCPLSSDQLSAQSVFSHLHKLSGLTEAVSSRQLYGCVSPGQDEGTWVLKKSRTLYGHGELESIIISGSGSAFCWRGLAGITCKIFSLGGGGGILVCGVTPTLGGLEACSPRKIVKFTASESAALSV